MSWKYVQDQRLWFFSVEQVFNVNGLCHKKIYGDVLIETE